MTYEQLSYWEGFKDSSPWLFDNLWRKMEFILEGDANSEDVTTGYWFINARRQIQNKPQGVVICVNDREYSLDTLFISRLTPAGFIQKKQLLINKDQSTCTTTCRLVEVRKNWKYFEFEPWTSLSQDPDHIASLEFDISELAIAAHALDSVTVEKITAYEAISVYRRWFPETY